MRTVAWITLGWLGVTFWTALGARIAPGGVIPDAAIVALVFLGLRREPIPVVVSAIVLGYLVGRQAMAPVGLHETAMVACAIGVYMVSGHLVGSGPLFFAMVAGAAEIGFHILLYGLAYLVGGRAGFVSWATAVLVPSAGATGLLALISYPWMIRLERRLSTERHEGLVWR
ncbi:MAG: hypothetical protein V3T05_11445 [Myxococcota bacterium]